MSKTGNYAGWCDRGYKRDDRYNGDRLVEHGLVACNTAPDAPIDGGSPPAEIIPTQLALKFNSKYNSIGLTLI